MTRPTLDAFMTAPPLDDLIAAIPRDQIPAAITALASRLLVEPASANGHGAPAPVAPDETLDAQAIAKLLKRSKRWVYRRQKRLPFLRRVGRGLVAPRGEVEKWMAAQRIK